MITKTSCRKKILDFAAASHSGIFVKHMLLLLVNPWHPGQRGLCCFFVSFDSDPVTVPTYP